MNRHPVVGHFDAAEGTLKSYTLGFILSLLLTISAYVIISRQIVSGTAAIALIAVLAITQLTVQLVFFLHLGRESRPRWNLTVFAFMLMVVIIVVFGSVWIMNNLDYHHGEMSPTETEQEIIKDEGINR